MGWDLGAGEGEDATGTAGGLGFMMSEERQMVRLEGGSFDGLNFKARLPPQGLRLAARDEDQQWAESQGRRSWSGGRPRVQAGFSPLRGTPPQPWWNGLRGRQSPRVFWLVGAGQRMLTIRLGRCSVNGRRIAIALNR